MGNSLVIFTVLSFISIIAAIAARVLLAAAVNFDARSRNLKSASLFTALVFFFPLIAGVIYASSREGGEPNEKYCSICNVKTDGAAKMCPNCNAYSLTAVPNPRAKELAKTGVKLCVIGIIVFAIGFGTGVARTVYAVHMGLSVAESIDEEKIEKWAEKFEDEFSDSEDESETEAETSAPETQEDTTDIDSIIGNLRYYDRDGKAYKDATDVPYYSKDGKTYFYRKEADLTQYFVEKDSDKKLDLKRCFVDKDGYFIYDGKGEITLDDIVTASDKNGNKYIPASLAIWNEKGELITQF